MEDNGFQINEASFQPNKLKEKKKTKTLALSRFCTLLAC